MNDGPDLPPIEIVTVDAISYGGVTRLRVRVAINSEDVDAVAKVAQAVLRQMDSDHDVIWLFFYFTVEAAVTEHQAELRALYVRHELRPNDRSPPLVSVQPMAEISSAHGILTVELSWFP